MNKVKEDLLLHPVRMRIILATAGRQVTAQQLASELPDIPQASLYRHINKLADAGVLTVVRERRVHNTLEKTYALPNLNLLLSEEDLKNAGPEDHLRIFSQYLGLLLGYYARYIQQGDINFARDNVFFDSFSLNLSKEEIENAKQGINAALLPFLKNEPSPERQRIIFGLVTLPDVAGKRLPTGVQTGPLAVEENEHPID